MACQEKSHHIRFQSQIKWNWKEEFVVETSPAKKMTGPILSLKAVKAGSHLR
jgi:hypothetical protein